MIALNKYAKFKYNILEDLEAGLVLKGTQVKAIKAKTFNLKESIIREKKGEFWLMNMYFSDPLIQKDIKLLLNKKEIKKIDLTLKQKKAYLVPLDLHFKGHLIKLQVGIGKHKKQFDKRDSIRKADDVRQIELELKNIRKY